MPISSIATADQHAIIPFTNKRLKVNPLIYAKDHKTGDLFSPFDILGKKRLKLLQKSWAELFRWQILPKLPVDALASCFSREFGRPTKELYSMMGLMLLQQMHDMTDEEAVQQFAFNLQWHYALNITSTDDLHAYVCPRTLWGVRALMCERGMEQQVFDVITGHLATLCNLDSSLQRMDSTHLYSNMKSLGRVTLFATTIRAFLRNLKRHHEVHYTALDQALLQRYMSKKGDAVFASTTPEHAKRTLNDVAADLLLLVRTFNDQDAIMSMTSYKHMVRLLNEQCITSDSSGNSDTKVSVEEGAVEERATDQHEMAPSGEEESAPCEEVISQVQPKPAKEIAGDSLQNPSDEDATYDGHKGQGYQVQIVETCTESPEDEGLSLITHAAVEPAHVHDSSAVVPAIEKMEAMNLAPERLLTDTMYGGDDNCLAAQEHGVELIAPVPGTASKEGKVGLDAFACNDGKQVAHCPRQCTPVQQKRGKRDGFVALFSASDCADCPMLERCRVTRGKKGFYLRYKTKDMRLALRRQRERSEEFRKLYAMRAGIEASNAELKQTTGAGRLRVRGLRAVRFAVVMKIVGVNIRRTTAFKIQENAPKGPNSEDDGAITSFP